MVREAGYVSPVAFYGALKHRAQHLARSGHLPVAGVLTSYFHHRLIARVFCHQPDAWMIKGGQALLLRYGCAARLSPNLNLQYRASARVEDAIAALHAAAAHDLGDYLGFVPGRLSRRTSMPAGAEQVFRVLMDAREVGVLRVDVVTGPAGSTPPDVHRVRPLIDLGWPASWPAARLCPLSTQLAEKVCAMFERHHGSASSRYRDLADVLLVSRHAALDGREVHTALHAEVQRRRLAGQPGLELALSQAFQAPGRVWPERYPAAARQLPGLRGCTSWPEAAAAADAFLTPLLAPAAPGVWDAHRSRWQDPLPTSDGRRARHRPVSPAG